MSVLIFVILFLLAHTVVNNAKCYTSKHTTTAGPTTANKGSSNMNIVLFFAETDSMLTYEDSKGISYLNIQLVTKIKPCTHRPESDLPQNFRAIIRSIQNKQCDCKRLLESSIQSLLGWAHNALGMSTAMVSLQNIGKMDAKNNQMNCGDHKTGAIENASKLPQNNQKGPSTNLQQRNPFMDPNDKAILEKLPLPYDKNSKTDDLPRLQYENDPHGQNVITINTYPREPKLKFNDIRRYHLRFRPEDFINVHRVKRQLVVEPENTQVFDIPGAKSHEDPTKMLELQSAKESKAPDSIWDLLGIMSTIKESFFVNFMNPMLNPKLRMLDEQNGLDFKSLGQTQGPSLFHVVKRMLLQLQQPTGDTNGNGYILVVFGEHLSEISDPYSELSQSVKHVLETTDQNRTLTVVTGNCPPNTIATESRPSRNKYDRKQNCNEALLPVYAKGPYSEMLSKCQELFDIPKQLQKIIKEHISNQTSNGQTGAPLNANCKNQSVQNVEKITISNQSLLGTNNSPSQMWISREVQNRIFGRIRKDVSSNSIKLMLSEYRILAAFLLIFIM